MESNIKNSEAEGLTKGKIEENVSLRLIFKDAFKYTPSKVLGMLMNILQVKIYTRILAPEQFGLIFVAYAVISFIARIFSDWVGLSALRFFEEHHKENNIKPYFTTFMFLICTNLGLMFATIYFCKDTFTEFFNVNMSLLIGIAFLIIPIAFRALLFQILRAQIKPFVYTMTAVINQLSTIGIAYYLITQHNYDFNGVLVAMAISIILIDIIMFFVTGMYKHLKFKAISFSSLKQCYVYGIPLAASSLGVWIITESDKLILQHFHGSFYNGLVGTGFSLTYKILMPLFAILTLAAIPRILQFYESKIDVRPIVSKITGYYIMIFAPFVFIAAFMPENVILAFSNEKYLAAAVFIPFLAISAFLMGLAEYTVIQYHLVKKTYIQTAIKLGPGILGVLLTIFMLPKCNSAHDVLLLLGCINVFSQLLYLLLSISIKIKDLEWQPPYQTLLNVTIALALSYAAMITTNEFISHFDEFYIFAAKSAVIGITYFFSLKLLNKIFNYKTV